MDPAANPNDHALSLELSGLLEAAVREIAELELTYEQLDQLFGSELALLGEIRQWGFDTNTNEGVADILARELVGRSWPTYGDGEQARKRFDEEFKAAAAKRGFLYIGDD